MYARIEGRSDGSLEFTGAATPKTDFLTARTGFVVLHPLERRRRSPGRGRAHRRGGGDIDAFPEQVDPVQPFLNLRSLTHEVMPGLKAAVRMQGDTFEMEDHRNWTDASFKTYVRPLALPWPYTLKAGETVRQSVSLTLQRRCAQGGRTARRQDGPRSRSAGRRDTRCPRWASACRRRRSTRPSKRSTCSNAAAPRLLDLSVRPAPGTRPQGAGRLSPAYASGPEPQCELEVVVESVDAFDAELTHVASLVRGAGLPLSAVAVCPGRRPQGMLPGSPRPPAPPLADLYDAARAPPFPGVRLGGGVFSFFTELNRKRPPAELLDFVHNGTCPIVACSRRPLGDGDARGAALPGVDGTQLHRQDALPRRSELDRLPRQPVRQDIRAQSEQRTHLPGQAATLDSAASSVPHGRWAMCRAGRPGSKPCASARRPVRSASSIVRAMRKQPYFDALGRGAVYPAYHVVGGAHARSRCHAGGRDVLGRRARAQPRLSGEGRDPSLAGQHDRAASRR